MAGFRQQANDWVLKQWKYFGTLTVVRLLCRSARLFHESRCPLWASALTYYSVFAVVPIFALLFGIAKGFGLEEWLNTLLTEKLDAHQDVLKLIMEFVDSTLRKTKGGVVAGIGVAVLLYSVIAMIRHIEAAFNTVLGIRRGRGIVRIFTDYLSMVFICPVLLVLAASATPVLNRLILKVFGDYPLLDSIGRPLFWAAKTMTPWLWATVIFTVLYIVLTNGKVRFNAALCGGVVSGALVCLLQTGYFHLQGFLNGYNTVYGSFAALPLFLLWMYLNWNLVMMGMVLAAAWQGLRTREFDEDDPDDGSVHDLLDRKMLLLLTALAVRDFAAGREAPSDEELAQRSGIGLRKVRQALQLLAEAHILNRVTLPEDEIGYSPTLPPDQMTVCEVLKRLDALFPARKPEQAEARKLCAGLIALDREQAASSFNRRLTDL